MDVFRISVVLLCAIPFCTSEIKDNKNAENSRTLNHVSSTSDILPSLRSGLNNFNLPDFVGFSYSRASIGGPKTRFIYFTERVR